MTVVSFPLLFHLSPRGINCIDCLTTEEDDSHVARLRFLCPEMGSKVPMDRWFSLFETAPGDEDESTQGWSSPHHTQCLCSSSKGTPKMSCSSLVPTFTLPAITYTGKEKEEMGLANVSSGRGFFSSFCSCFFSCSLPSPPVHVPFLADEGRKTTTRGC